MGWETLRGDRQRVDAPRTALGRGRNSQKQTVNVLGAEDHDWDLRTTTGILATATNLLLLLEPIPGKVAGTTPVIQCSNILHEINQYFLAIQSEFIFFHLIFQKHISDFVAKTLRFCCLLCP